MTLILISHYLLMIQHWHCWVMGRHQVHCYTIHITCSAGSPKISSGESNPGERVRKCSKRSFSEVGVGSSGAGSGIMNVTSSAAGRRLIEKKKYIDAMQCTYHSRTICTSYNKACVWRKSIELLHEIVNHTSTYMVDVIMHTKLVTSVEIRTLFIQIINANHSRYRNFWVKE